MNDLADLADGCFENAMRGWIGDHQRSQVVLVRVGFGAEIGEIDIAILQAGDWHNLEAGHDGAGRVGPMR
jgi:hypothetical protein